VYYGPTVVYHDADWYRWHQHREWEERRWHEEHRWHEHHGWHHHHGDDDDD
jgi:hypothetical protein